MDPLSATVSAAGLAKAVWEMAWGLYRFSQEVKHNNTAVGNVSSELLWLCKAVAGIEATLTTPQFQDSLTTAALEKDELFAIIRGNLHDARATLSAFQQVLHPLLPEQSNVAKMALRTLKITVKRSEIASFRARLQAHINVLNISLQTLNLRAITMAPDAVYERIVPAIDGLRRAIERRGLTAAMPDDMSMKIRSVQDVARREVRSATSAASSRASQGLSEGGITDANRQGVESWIHQSPAHHSAAWGPPSSRGDNAADLVDETAESTAAAADEDYDPGEELDSEIARAMVAEGRRLFNDSHFAAAHTQLHAALSHIESLPLKLQDADEIRAIQMQLVKCACYSPNIAAAKKLLRDLTDADSTSASSASDDDALRRCEAYHMLALVLFREREYAAAQNKCRKAIEGFRLTVGRDDARQHDCMFLMAQIYEALDSPVLAAAYRKNIPAEVLLTLTPVSSRFPESPDVRPSGSFAGLGEPMLELDLGSSQGESAAQGPQQQRHAQQSPPLESSSSQTQAQPDIIHDPTSNADETATIRRDFAKANPGPRTPRDSAVGSSFSPTLGAADARRNSDDDRADNPPAAAASLTKRNSLNSMLPGWVVSLGRARRKSSAAAAGEGGERGALPSSSSPSIEPRRGSGSSELEEEEKEVAPRGAAGPGRQSFTEYLLDLTAEEDGRVTDAQPSFQRGIAP